MGEGQDLNHYPRHVGDIITATIGLSLMERGAYDALLDQYYAREAPLPLDRKEVYRLAAANGAAERKAVDYVIARFFKEEPDGWHQARCDEEIALYLDGDEGRERKRDNERERAKRHREERKRLFGELRAYDIVPKYDATTDALRAMLADAKERASNARVTRDGHAESRELSRTVTSDITANHKPVARSQEPEAKNQEPQSHPLGAPKASTPTPKTLARGSDDPVAPKAAKPDSATGETWNAYAEAFRQRYGVEATCNARVRGQLAQLVQRVGKDDAPHVAAFYVGLNNGYYVGKGHGVGPLLADAEKLHAEWKRGRAVTQAEARMADETQARGNVWGGLIEEARNGTTR